MLRRKDAPLLSEMYDLEVCVTVKVPPEKFLALLRARSNAQTLEEGREAEISYDRKLIRVSLTNLWDMASGDYAAFVDELVGILLHEYLHYFFYTNQIPQNEQLIERLSTKLLLLSLGHLIGEWEN